MRGEGRRQEEECEHYHADRWVWKGFTEAASAQRPRGARGREMGEVRARPDRPTPCSSSLLPPGSSVATSGKTC